MTSVGISLALSFPNILLFILNKFIWKKEHINCIFVVLSFIFHYGISNIIVEFVTFGKLVIIIYSILFALLNLCLSFGKIKLNKSGFIYLFKKLFAKSINQVVDQQRKLQPHLMLQTEASHLESREVCEEYISCIGPVVKPIGDPYNPVAFRTDIERITKRTHIYESEWKRVDKGGGKISSVHFRKSDCEYRTRIDVYNNE